MNPVGCEPKMGSGTLVLVAENFDPYPVIECIFYGLLHMESLVK